MDLASPVGPTAPSGSLSAFLSGDSRHGVRERMRSPDPGAQHAKPQWSSGEPLETDRLSWLVGPGQRRDPVRRETAGWSMDGSRGLWDPDPPTLASDEEESMEQASRLELGHLDLSPALR